MSENEKNTTHGEPISEEQLGAVAGGIREGSSIHPLRDNNCWFGADGMPREDGRTRCKTECKGIFDANGKPVIAVDVREGANENWWICHCWGTDSCVDKMHRPCGKPARTNW